MRKKYDKALHNMSKHYWMLVFYKLFFYFLQILLVFDFLFYVSASIFFLLMCTSCLLPV